MKFGYTFSWSPEPGGKITTSGQWFDTKGESDAAFKRALTNLGYTRPRWWQYWRWGEHVPSVLEDTPHD